jgi:HSP20 family protein
MAKKSTNGQNSTLRALAGTGTLAAAVILMISAVVTVLQGVSALSSEKFLVRVPDSYLYRLNPTAWGCIMIILGVLVGAVAVGLFRGALWARTSAIVIACISIVSMFMWLPYSPTSSIVVIALDIFVIWAIANWQSPWAHSTGNKLENVIGGGPGQLPPRLQRSPFADWFAGLPSWATFPPVFGGQPIRLEDEMKDGRYEVRAELPGIDPAKDVDITAHNGVLTIKAQRGVKTRSDGHSEFSYGTFTRSVQLPPGAREDDISATHDKGILTVAVGMSDVDGPAHKRVHVVHSS